MKKFALMGMVLSILICVFGAIVFFSKAPNEEANLSWYDTTYLDSGFTAFGGDFYTYVNNNTAQAAEALMASVRNQYDIVTQISKSCAAVSKAGGVLLLALGMLGFCGFGIVYNVPEKPPYATYSATESIIVKPSSDEQQADAGEWQCTCGRVHKNYVSSCSCGVNKRDLANTEVE